MLSAKRNTLEKDDWILEKIDDFSSIAVFDCGDNDLNDFFRKDAQAHKEQLLAETYVLLQKKAQGVPVALFSLSNDVIRLEKIKGKIAIPPGKNYRDWPAVKIGRFGVLKDFQGQNIGSFVLNMIKCLFLTENRTGCRFITVDAYNDKKVIRFYGKNDFQMLTEKDNTKPTRAMFFDLKRLQELKIQC